MRGKEARRGRKGARVRGLEYGSEDRASRVPSDEPGERSAAQDAASSAPERLLASGGDAVIGRAVDGVVAKSAARAYAASARRTAVLGVAVSVDPAWNILLDLLVSEADGRALSVTSACLGSGTSTTTGIRYLGLLEASGLVARVPDPTDRRRTHVRLTPQGRSAVVALLDEEEA